LITSAALAVGVGTVQAAEITAPAPASPQSFRGSTATPAEFRVLATDTSLLPVLIRWAQTDGLMPVLDGRRVTTRSLRDDAYADLPLTAEARAVTGTTAEQAITSILKTYAPYRSDLEVTAQTEPPYILAITTRRAQLGATAAPLPSPAAPPAAQQPAPRFLTPERSRSEAPATLTTSAKVEPEKTWDAPARKAAGVMRGTWVVGNSPSLRSVVEAWARQSGYHVEWTSRRDYRISDDIRAGTYTGTFQEALMRLANAFGQLEAPLGMSFSSSAGGKALRVFDL
jgi:hypothetical protein